MALDVSGPPAPDPPETTPVPRSRRATVSIFVAGLISALFVGLAAIASFHAYRVFHPRSATPDSVDAVVVLAGGRGERLRTALALVEEGDAPLLVANVGNRDWGLGWELLEPICQEAEDGHSGSNDYEVLCVTVAPDNTAGEARTISALAEEQDWRSIALVTSDDHLHRATLRFERCFDGEILPVPAASPPGEADHLDEWFATMHAVLIDRSCDHPSN